MDGDTDIHRLDEDTVARIAAGEVVERPASAVKELVENSLDADATRIDVTVEAGGTELIRVADDGLGMSEADLRAAVRQHTTSKIADLEDLEGGVTTLGFRGEALHTIGSVSRLRIRSRPRANGDGGSATETTGTDATGTELVYEGGEVTSVGPVGCPEGTSVEVTDLFYNTPARRKFLKTKATEFAHVNRVVTRYALANPDVAISLTHDGREVFATTGQGDLQAAVLSVYGREVAASMIPVEASGDDLPTGPVESVSGLVSHPETNRSTREYLATYVNGRAITADAIRDGIVGAYGTQLGTDRYPFVVCFLSVPGEAVDVNVHPRKREVRFDDADAVRRQVDSAVESALLDHGLLRSGAPRGRSKPDEATVEPESASHRTDTDPTRSSDGVVVPEDEAGRGETVSESETASVHDADAASRDRGDGTDVVAKSTGTDGTVTADGRRSESARGTQGSRPDSPADTAVDVDNSPDAGSSIDSSSPGPTGDSGSPTPTGDSSSTAPTDGSGSTAPTDGTDTSTPTGGSEGDSRSLAEPSRKFAVTSDQRTLDGDVAEIESEYETLPPLRVIGQLHDTYLVCETPDGLALIDQHAADERVNYERLQRAVAENPAAQALADPVELELTAAESAAFADVAEALTQLGFRADRVDKRTVAVTAVPAVFDQTLDPAQLRDVLAAIVTGDGATGAETVDTMADEFLGDLACYPSITGNTSLHEGSVRELLDALDDCRNPYACPHGRPVIVHVDETEIEERFERDYPGHGG
ncbi:DNA mismatch repair endonuclease MutL [Halovivax cerinus]|uniref:DNA mismatch repair protein MutL n=1 Tax=Halovivax cerinus TaxID=1487865 RepID=A0ABD5NLF1_9EURY|nr:DNA mismatch repair endonuclease MutL [Halovivax cerinus]